MTGITIDNNSMKMVSADTNWEQLSLESIEDKYKVRFDLDLHQLFKSDMFTVNPVEIQILRELQIHNKGAK